MASKKKPTEVIETPATPLSFSVRLKRSVKRDHGAASDQLGQIATDAIDDNIKMFWDYSVVMEPMREGDDGAKIYCGTITFTRTARKTIHEDAHVALIREKVIQLCKKGNFKTNPWYQIDESGNVISPFDGTVIDNDNPFEGEFIKWDELNEFFMKRKDHLRGATDEEIEAHECFHGIYGLGAQIRVALDAIYTAIETKGLTCHHIILYGEPGGAKTTMAQALCRYIDMCIPDDYPGKGFAWLSADSSTGAGIQMAFHQKWRTSGIPPVVGFEEGEKVAENFWQSMLGALDTRQTMMKLNARRTDITKTKMLAIVTVNDVERFDSFLGGHTKNGKMIPGAISSRFSTRIEVPRPPRSIMHQILMREIEKYADLGWKEEWADAALAIAAEVETNDPREILRFLDGQDRLLDGSYLEDIQATRMASQRNRETYRESGPVELLPVFSTRVTDGIF